MLLLLMTDQHQRHLLVVASASTVVVGLRMKQTDMLQGLRVVGLSGQVGRLLTSVWGRCWRSVA
jgi:hypothetical protein